MRDDAERIDLQLTGSDWSYHAHVEAGPMIAGQRAAEGLMTERVDGGGERQTAAGLLKEG